MSRLQAALPLPRHRKRGRSWSRSFLPLLTAHGLVREAREIDACSDPAECAEEVLEELINGPVGDMSPTLPATTTTFRSVCRTGDGDGRFRQGVRRGASRRQSCRNDGGLLGRRLPRLQLSPASRRCSSCSKGSTMPHLRTPRPAAAPLAARFFPGKKTLTYDLAQGRRSLRIIRLLQQPVSDRRTDFMKKPFLQAIRERVLVLDGAMGTMLQERGLKPGQSPEELNLTMPEVVAGVHREYLRGRRRHHRHQHLRRQPAEARPLRPGREAAGDQRRGCRHCPRGAGDTGLCGGIHRPDRAVSSSRSATSPSTRWRPSSASRPRP